MSTLVGQSNEGNVPGVKGENSSGPDGVGVRGEGATGMQGKAELECKAKALQGEYKVPSLPQVPL